MDYLSLILLAFGLSLDDFALAFALSLVLPTPTSKTRIIHACKMAIAFSISTCVLPLLGWLIGLAIYNWVVAIGAWVVLIIFCGVGGWVIKEAFEDETSKWTEKNITSFWGLMVIGTLGSIDEGAVGIGYPFLDIPIISIIVWVIIVNTLLIFAAAWVSSWTSHINQKMPVIAAGVILIILGILNWLELLGWM